ncbi:unnamed protein product, partial [Amoebophrya sp. A25]|eukprot:GSA25T00004836001.1
MSLFVSTKHLSNMNILSGCLLLLLHLPHPSSALHSNPACQCIGELEAEAFPSDMSYRLNATTLMV